MIYTIGESGMTHISYCFPDCVHMLGLGAWRQHGDPLTTFKTLKHYVFEIIQKASPGMLKMQRGGCLVNHIYIYMAAYRLLRGTPVSPAPGTFWIRSRAGLNK